MWIKHNSVRLVALMALVALAPGCAGGDFRPTATGKDGEVVVVIDSSRWNGPIGDAIQSTVGKYVGTLPVPERQFDLRVVSLGTDRDLDRVRQLKNVMFVSPLSDTTNEAKYLKNVFSEEAQAAIRSGQGSVVSRPNLWRRSQQVYYVTGDSARNVAQAIRDNGDAISHTFNEISRQRAHRDMFKKGQQKDVEQELMEGHGFAVDVQHDYLIAIDTTDFVWLRRILPDTWRSLFVYSIDGADPSVLDPNWIYALRDSLTRQYIQGELAGWVEIDYRRPLETESINFVGRYGFASRGLWHVIDRKEDDEMIEMGMGGPFVNYTFYDAPSGRIYMIDGMVFAPGFNKREFLRQMEVIAYTFRTRHDVDEAQQPASAE